MCRQLEDSNLPAKKDLNNYSIYGNNNYVKYDHVNWLENKMCCQLDDSYLPAKNDLDKYGNYGNNTFDQIN